MAAHGPGGEGLIVGGDEKDVRDTVKVFEEGGEEWTAGGEDGGGEEDDGAEDRGDRGAVTTGKEPVNDEEAGGDFDGGGEGKEDAGGEGRRRLARSRLRMESSR